MQICGQNQEIPRKTSLYYCCKLGEFNKIGESGFGFLREAAKRVDCERKYKQDY